MNLARFIELRQLKDLQDRPLLQPDPQQGNQLTLLGYPISTTTLIHVGQRRPEEAERPTAITCSPVRACVAGTARVRMPQFPDLGGSNRPRGRTGNGGRGHAHG